MQAKFEVTKKYAAAYQRASKKDKGPILDQVVEVTGWNRDHARQGLAGHHGVPKAGPRRPLWPGALSNSRRTLYIALVDEGARTA